MKVGLIDVDAQKKVKFPNLALMRISAWHKSRGDVVEWWQPPLIEPMYDVVYMSKVFSEDYSPDVPEPMNAAVVIKGGTGYCITLDEDGRERFDAGKHKTLEPEIERMFPDYSIYPQFRYALSMTSRGCPRGCPFCHVVAKEGRGSVKVADVRDFWNGQPHIEVLDANITACGDKRDLFRQYMETGATICFSQGLDIRLLDDEDIYDLKRMRVEDTHFAWDNAREDLRERFAYYAKHGKKNRHGNYGMVYVLTNYNSTQEQDLYRIYTLREMGFNPYVMVYDKPHAPKAAKRLQKWCNSVVLSCASPRYEDYR